MLKISRDILPSEWGTVRNMPYIGLPYYLSEIRIENIIKNEEVFYYCKIDMGLIIIELYCKEIIIGKIDFISVTDKKYSDIKVEI